MGVVSAGSPYRPPDGFGVSPLRHSHYFFAFFARTGHFIVLFKSGILRFDFPRKSGQSIKIQFQSDRIRSGFSFVGGVAYSNTGGLVGAVGFGDRAAQ